MPADNCILCGKTTTTKSDLVTHIAHLLDGSTREGPVCSECFFKPYVGFRLCPGCSEEGIRHLYVLSIYCADYTIEMPEGCPVHGEPEQSLAFMLWWARYREEHRDGR